MLREYERVCQPGGTIRITEGSLLIESTSPALTRLFGLAQEAFYQSGHFFTNEPDSVIAYLGEQMEKYGIVDVQIRTCRFAFHDDPHTLQAFAHDVRGFFRQLSLFSKSGHPFPRTTRPSISK